MVDEPLAGIRADHKARNAQTIAILVDRWGNYMVVKSTPVIPGQEDGRTVPFGPLHGCVDQAGHIGLAGFDTGGWVLADFTFGHDPGDLRQCPILGGFKVIVNHLDVAELTIR